MIGIWPSENATLLGFTKQKASEKIVRKPVILNIFCFIHVLILDRPWTLSTSRSPKGGSSSQSLKVSASAGPTTLARAHDAAEGRLQQAALDLLSGSDLQFRRDGRLDISLVKNHHIALMFLPAADIPGYVAEGGADLGITGRDQVAEYEASSPATEHSGMEEVLDLGFGQCKLQVQVPEGGKIGRPEDLVGKTVGTSFVALTEQYFARLEGLKKGMVNGDAPEAGKLRTKIKRLSGSVEIACASRRVDGIVDLVGTFLGSLQC